MTPFLEQFTPNAATTYQSAEWHYRHASRIGDGHPDSCMVTSADNLPAQIAKMRDQGYLISRITLATYCANCQGSGRVKHKRIAYRLVPCKVCHGHEGTLSIEPYKIPDPGAGQNAGRM